MKTLLKTLIIIAVGLIFISCEPKERCYQQITVDSVSYELLYGAETPKFVRSADTTIWCDEIVPSPQYYEWKVDTILKINQNLPGIPCYEVHHQYIIFKEI